MKKNIKKENMKAKEHLKKATRENKNIEEQLDEVSGGFLFGGGAGIEMEDIEIGPINTSANVTGLTFEKIKGDIKIKTSGKNNTVQNTGGITINR